MHGLRGQAEWFQRIGALTVEEAPRATAVDGSADPVGSGPSGAEQRIRRLADTAHTYQATVRCHHPTTGQCALDAVNGGREACGLAAAMSDSTDATPAHDAVVAYLSALRGAATAVYYCRKIAHPVGQCWFRDTLPNLDGCGEVLAATHRLG